MDDPVKTWEGMKEKLMLKYVPRHSVSNYWTRGIDGIRETSQPSITSLNLMKIFESVWSNRVRVSRTDLI